MAVAALGVGFLVGSMTAGESGSVDTDATEVADLRAKVAQLEAQLGRRDGPGSMGAALEGRGASKPCDAPADKGTPQTPGEPPESFDISKYENAKEAFAGLQQSTNAKAWGAFAQASIGLKNGPDKEWIAWALETYEIPDPVRKMLEGRLKSSGGCRQTNAIRRHTGTCQRAPWLQRSSASPSITSAPA